MKNLTKKQKKYASRILLLCSLLFVLFPATYQSRAATISFTADTTLTVNNVSLIIASGSTASQLNVNEGSFTVNTAANETFTIISTNRYGFSTSIAKTLTCTSSQSQLVVNGGENITITPLTSPASCSAAQESSAPQSSAGGSAQSAQGSSNSGGSSRSCPASPVNSYKLPSDGKTPCAITLKNSISEAEIAITKGTKFTTKENQPYDQTISSALLVDPEEIPQEIPYQGRTIRAIKTLEQVVLDEKASLSFPLIEELRDKKLEIYEYDDTKKGYFKLPSEYSGDKSTISTELSALGKLLVLFENHEKIQAAQTEAEVTKVDSKTKAPESVSGQEITPDADPLEYPAAPIENTENIIVEETPAQSTTLDSSEDEISKESAEEKNASTQKEEDEKAQEEKYQDEAGQNKTAQEKKESPALEESATPIKEPIPPEDSLIKIAAHEVIFNNKIDTDGNGVNDYWEIVYGDGGADTVNIEIKDSDLDGLSDKEEFTYKTSPVSIDTDKDGLSDEQEINNQTDPGKSDTDGDGFSDFAELMSQSHPSDKKSTPRDNNSNKVADTWEENFNLEILNGSTDSDNDGCSDKIEYQFNSNPLKSDSDGDGLSDCEELFEYETPVNIPIEKENAQSEIKITNWGWDELSRDQRPLFKGVAPAESEVELWVQAFSEYGIGQAEKIGHSIASANSKFLIEPGKKLENGSFIFFVKAKNNSNLEESPKVLLHVDSSINIETPSITTLGSVDVSAGNTNIEISENRPKISGKIDEDALLLITWSSLVYTSTLLVDASSGTFESAPPQDLEPGEHQVQIYSYRNSDKAHSEKFSLAFTIAGSNLFEVGNEPTITEPVIVHTAEKPLEKNFPYNILQISTGVLFVIILIMMLKRWKRLKK